MPRVLSKLVVSFVPSIIAFVVVGVGLCSMDPCSRDVLAAGRPAYGGEVTLALPVRGTERAPSPLDPAQARTSAELTVADAVHAGLFRYDNAGRVRPHLLDGEPRWLDGGRRLRCRLSRPLRFQGGRTVTSADVKWSLGRLGESRLASPLAWLPSVIRVRVIDRRTFDIELAAGLSRAGLSRNDIVRLLAAPQAAILPRRGDGRRGLGPFRVERWEAAGGRLVAWDEAPGGRPFLDELRFVAISSDSSEPEAFHYGQLDLSFTDSPRLSDRPRLAGPLMETIVAVFSPRWRRAGTRAAARVDRRALAALLGTRRGELLRHFDLPAVPARRLRPGREPVSPARAGSAGERAGEWPGESLTVAWPIDEPLLADVASAVRDILSRDILSGYDMAQATALPRRAVPPACGLRCDGYDLLITTVAWPSVFDGACAAWSRAWLGESWSGEPGSAESSAELVTRLIDDAWVIPLLHLRRVVRYDAALVGLRFVGAGGLSLEDAWRRAPSRREVR